MAFSKLRDRDALVTADNIIFRVYGYFHPPDAYVCDPEYVSETVYRSKNPRAPRGIEGPLYYKFYADEGLRFVQKEYPCYKILYEPLQERLVGVPRDYIVKIRRPGERFQQLIKRQPEDDLIKALHSLSALVIPRSGLSGKDFGVFGSILHGFYHPRFSDLDLIVYGRQQLTSLVETLHELYNERDSMVNEFDSRKALEGKHWRFKNYTPKEYLWHQRRKMIYALFKHKEVERVLKTEFEPVKDWNEICNEYNPDTRVHKKGWVKAVARVIGDQDAPFIPSIYQIEVLEILEGRNVENIQRILSFVEEFRMQVKRDEEVYVEGNIEEVASKAKTFDQITLTYGPRYYEQTLKVIR